MEKTHKHKCEKCGHIWSHENGIGRFDAEVFNKAHECSECGAQQQCRKYFTKEQAEAKANCIFKLVRKWISEEIRQLKEQESAK